MQYLTELMNSINAIVWGVPMIVLILGTGLFLQIRLGFMPIFKIGHGFRMIMKGRVRDGDAAEPHVQPGDRPDLACGWRAGGRPAISAARGAAAPPAPAG